MQRWLSLQIVARLVMCVVGVVVSAATRRQPLPSYVEDRKAREQLCCVPESDSDQFPLYPYTLCTVNPVAPLMPPRIRETSARIQHKGEASCARLSPREARAGMAGALKAIHRTHVVVIIS